MRRIILRTETAAYRAFGFDFRQDKDGSLYIETKTAKTLDGSGGQSVRISYHATGRINYVGAINETLFGEPTFAISKPLPLMCLSLGSVDRLPLATDRRDDDMLFRCPKPVGERLSLHLWITPSDSPLQHTDAAAVTYDGWFSIQILSGPPPKMDLRPDENRVVVLESPHKEQAVSQEKALIFVHQKTTGSNDLIMYWEAANHCVRLIFAVPMRIPPALTVEFAETGLEVVPLEPIIRNTATAELRFKVRGPGGFLTVPPTITKLMLDAEL